MPTDPMEEPTKDEDDSPCIGAEETPEVTSTAHEDYHSDRWS